MISSYIVVGFMIGDTQTRMQLHCNRTRYTQVNSHEKDNTSFSPCT